MASNERGTFSFFLQRIFFVYNNSSRQFEKSSETFHRVVFAILFESLVSMCGLDFTYSVIVMKQKLSSL